jgi:glycosyltransferase involved in cell wall biosynthesis
MSDNENTCEAAEISEKSSLVSIVIPVYNVSSYLAQCLESVIHQSYHNIEIIIINDGSTDGSGLICDRFSQCDDRIRVIHTDNRGLSSARNCGLKACSGSYLLFVDSDDWIEADTVETLLDYAKTYNADIAAAKSCKEFVGQTVYPPKAKEEIRVFHGDEILPAYGKGLFRDVVWNKLYLAGCFSGIQFPDGHNYEDVSVTWKIMKNLADEDGTVVVLSKPLFHFRMRKSSISHTESCCNIIDAWAAYHEKYIGMPDYRQQFLPACFFIIGRMWLNYFRFSGEERGAASGIVLEMRSFSKEHFHHVMKGPFSKKVKAICLISQSSSPLLMWFCFAGGFLFKKIRNAKRRRSMYV